jgi:hypothetical protein
MAPFAKVGGLADVVAALATEQVRAGHRVLVALPHYRDLVLPAGWTVSDLSGTLVPWGMGHEPARFRVAEGPPGQPTVLLVDHAGDRRLLPARRDLRRSEHARGLSRQSRALPVLHPRRARGDQGLRRALRRRARARSAGGMGAVLRAHARCRGRRLRRHRDGVHHPQPRLSGHRGSVGARARRLPAQCVPSQQPVRVPRPSELHEGRHPVRRSRLDRESDLRARDPDHRRVRVRTRGRAAPTHR